MNLKRLSQFLLFRVLVAVILGIIASFFFPEWLARVFATFNSLFGNFLGFFVPVLIFALITPAIAGLGRGAGKWLGATTGVAYASTVLSGLLAYAVAAGAYPWLLGGRATGTAVVGEETWNLDGAQVYGEKNWGHEGFPDSWWWGQAHGFAESGACVAFAGGLVTDGRLRVEVTGLVVRLPDGRVIRLGNPVVSPVRARTSDERWRLSGRGYGWRIEVDATAPLDQAFVLPVPLPSEHRNTPGDLEHLVGDMEVSVHRFGRHVWTGKTSLAALEHGGLDRARGELRRRGLDEMLPAAPPLRSGS